MPQAVEVDFMSRHMQAIQSSQRETNRHGDLYSFSKDLNALMAEMKANPDKHYVINAQQILALDTNESDDDKKAIRLMHLLAQVQKGALPANAEIINFDRACHIVHETTLNTQKEDRIKQTQPMLISVLA